MPTHAFVIPAESGIFKRTSLHRPRVASAEPSRCTIHRDPGVRRDGGVVEADGGGCGIETPAFTGMTGQQPGRGLDRLDQRARAT